MAHTMYQIVCDVKKFLFRAPRGNERVDPHLPVSGRGDATSNQVNCCTLGFAGLSGFPDKLFGELEGVHGVFVRLFAEFVSG